MDRLVFSLSLFVIGITKQAAIGTPDKNVSLSRQDLALLKHQTEWHYFPAFIEMGV